MYYIYYDVNVRMCSTPCNYEMFTCATSLNVELWHANPKWVIVIVNYSLFCVKMYRSCAFKVVLTCHKSHHATNPFLARSCKPVGWMFKHNLPYYFLSDFIIESSKSLHFYFLKVKAYKFNSKTVFKYYNTVSENLAGSSRNTSR